MNQPITFERLLAIAEELPGDPECEDFSKLDAALGRLASHHMGRDVLGSDWLKAAALLETLARLRPLTRYNRQYAWLAAESYLQLNGVQLRYQPDAALQIVADSENSRATVVQIAAQLRRWAA